MVPAAPPKFGRSHVHLKRPRAHETNGDARTASRPRGAASQHARRRAQGRTWRLWRPVGSPLAMGSLGAPDWLAELGDRATALALMMGNMHSRRQAAGLDRP
jgi:hypothetical protein